MCKYKPRRASILLACFVDCLDRRLDRTRDRSDTLDAPVALTPMPKVLAKWRTSRRTMSPTWSTIITKWFDAEGRIQLTLVSAYSGFTRSPLTAAGTESAIRRGVK